MEIKIKPKSEFATCMCAYVYGFIYFIIISIPATASRSCAALPAVPLSAGANGNFSMKSETNEIYISGTSAISTHVMRNPASIYYPGGGWS
jgi:hypothetical protein